MPRGKCECQWDAHFDQSSGWHSYQQDDMELVTMSFGDNTGRINKCVACAQKHAFGARIIGDDV